METPEDTHPVDNQQSTQFCDQKTQLGFNFRYLKLLLFIYFIFIFLENVKKGWEHTWKQQKTLIS